MLEKGVVVKSTGKWYIVAMPDGSHVNCRIRGKLRLDGLRTTNPLSVGDIVHVSDEIDGEGNRMIEDFDPRRNYIVRKSTNLSKQKQIIAANIDRAYLIVTLKSPVTHLAFIDRFLVAAESFRIPTTLLFNKTDLLNKDELEYIEALRFMYGECGYPSEIISAKDGGNIDFLREEIKGKQVVISGHSGVGKSTLINALDPNLNVKTGAISKAHQQGQHTTTFAEMHQLETGGYIIDTPGIRAFGIVDLDKAVISHYFPEMRERMQDCKFHNCLHINEPHCAIKAAVESGEIFESRYDTYLQLMEEDENEVHRKNPFA
ncbi:MAG: ribosome small subunit-dependent GTPase A [Fluviicola sp.]